MKILTFTLIAFITLNCYSQNIVGLWQTVDEDRNNFVTSIIEIYETENNTFEGKITKGFDENGIKICEKCKGDKKGKPTIGMTILTGLTQKGKKESYENGKILDPRSGYIYSCNVNIENENTLKIRGYLGFSLIGQTDTWYRLTEN